MRKKSPLKYNDVVVCTCHISLHWDDSMYWKCIPAPISKTIAKLFFPNYITWYSDKFNHNIFCHCRVNWWVPRIFLFIYVIVRSKYLINFLNVMNGCNLLLLDLFHTIVWVFRPFFWPVDVILLRSLIWLLSHSYKIYFL